MIVFGSGPIRIGQGIEFDYASVHCVWSLLKKAGPRSSLSTTTRNRLDRLRHQRPAVFEPADPEDVMNVIETEKPIGVVVAFGGQTAIKLTKIPGEQRRTHHRHQRRIPSTWPEDRERFDELLERCIKRAAGHTVMTCEEALAANEIGYPVLMRPSYVLGGQNMIIAFTEDDIREYMDIIILSHEITREPILIDKYMMGTDLKSTRSATVRTS